MRGGIRGVDRDHGPFAAKACPPILQQAAKETQWLKYVGQVSTELGTQVCTAGPFAAVPGEESRLK